METKMVSSARVFRKDSLQPNKHSLIKNPLTNNRGGFFIFDLERVMGLATLRRRPTLLAFEMPFKAFLITS